MRERAPAWAVGLLLVASCAPSVQTLHRLDHQSFAFGVAFLPGDRVGCALLEGGEYRLAIYDAESGQRRRTLRLAPGEYWLHDLAVSEDGRRLAAAFRSVESRDGQLRAAGQLMLIDLSSGAIVGRHDLPRPARAVAFVDDGLLAVGIEASYHGTDPPRPRPGTARLCLLQLDGQIRACRGDHDDTVAAVARLPRGQGLGGARLISGSWDATLRLWSADLRPLGRLEAGAAVNAIALATDVPLAAVATSTEPPRRSREIAATERAGRHRSARPTHAVQLWDLSRRRHTTLHRHTAPAVAVAIDARGQQVASGGWDWRVWARRQDGGAVLLEGFSQILTALAIDPAHRLAVASWTAHRSGAPSCALFQLSR
jgi:WD40 repeat protein